MIFLAHPDLCIKASYNSNPGGTRDKDDPCVGFHIVLISSLVTSNSSCGQIPVLHYK
jgi:hypothetical protein